MDKNSSDEAVRRWRSAVTIVKNLKRIFELETEKEIALPLLTEKEHIADINQGTNQSSDGSTPKSNDSPCPADPPSVLASSSFNGNIGVFTGISTRENTNNTHSNVELASSFLRKTEHRIDIIEDNFSRGTDQSGDGSTQKTNESSYPSSSYNGNVDVSNGISMRENTNTHSNAESLSGVLIEPEQRVENGTNNCGDCSTLQFLKWIFVILNFMLELPSAVFDQLSSEHKPHFALIAMLMSLIAILVCIVELIYKGRTENVTWRWKRIPWFYDPSSGTRFGSFADILGLGCAIPQFIVTTINYSFFDRRKNEPIKISVWPIIFAFGLLCSKCWENANRTS